MTKSEVMKLVKQKCLDCCGFDSSEIKKCTVKNCALFPIKGGKIEKEKNERPKKQLSPEHLAALKAGRERRKLVNLK